MFRIEADNFEWINGEQECPDDLCLHGHATAVIGDETFEYDCTVSATVLYLLKSLEEDHIIGRDIQMLPCCGHSIWLKNDGSGDVFVSGCPNGIDWSIFHDGDNVRLVTESGRETLVPLNEYKAEVFRLADKVEEFYLSCLPKMPEEYDKEAYTAFWNEWRRRRNA